jgi:multidrug efflux system membrane fusion protein
VLGAGALVGVIAAFARINHAPSGPSLRGPVSGAAPVSVALATRRDVAVVERTIGTVLANTAVEVTARVQGVVVSAAFREGQDVKAGDPLFQIDARPYDAALAEARAQLAKDEAQLTSAENSEKRYRSIYEQHLSSSEQLDAAVAATGSAAATVQADRASIALAELNLEFTKIRSPVDGKTGPILVQPGNMVSANGTTPLVTINQIRPIKVSFALPQTDLPRIQGRVRAGGLVASIDQQGEGGGTFAAPVDFVSNHVDDTSGTIELRATFDNADASLVPGQLVNVTVVLSDIPGATVVPREAVNAGPDGLYAYAITPDSRAAQRTVRVLFDDGADAAIEGDIRPGDRVIVDGQLRVVPGAAVLVDEAPRATAAAAESQPGA